MKPERLGTLDRSVPAGYEALDELGRGAAATVLRVRRADDGGVYALKVLDSVDAETAADMAALAAFRREAALLACVGHPGLARIHEVGAVEGQPYLIMDLVEGESLAQVLERGPLPPARVVELALDLIDPLTAVHNGGLVHRDLKPDNIMIRRDGRAQLIDFGLAARDASGSADVAAGTAVGTLIYAPPEQSGLLQRPVDNRSDLYSLGVVLFECLTGGPPFTGADVGELLRMHAVTPAPDLRELVPGIPDGLAAAVAALLAKDPDDRYQHGAELAADLRMIGADPDGPFASSRGTLGPDPGGRTAMVGRGAELALLTRRWAAARGPADGPHTGGVCVIRGGGGVGKSRLASELAALAGASGAIVLHATAVADDPVPLAPLRHAIDRYLAAVEAAPPEARTGAVERIRACAGAAAPLLATLSPGLARAFGDPPAGAESVTEDRQDQFTTAVAGFLTALAESSGGALLVVDDVQWLDPGTRRVLARIAGDLAEVPLLVVATARTGDAAAEEVVAAFGPAADLELTVESLDHDDVAELIQLLVPGSGDELRLLVARAGGNPMVVREYLRAVVDAGLLRPSWGHWVLDEDGLDALALPQDALGLLLTRLHDVGPEQHELLATAALMGAVFRPDVLDRVHGGPVAGTLSDAVARGLLEPRDGGTYAFLHNGIREALAADLDAASVARQHAAIAAALESPGGTHAAPEHVYAVAHHYASAGAEAPVERALPACVAAGELALREHAPAEAVRFLTHAADLAADPDARLLVSLGTALKQLGRFTDATERFEAALEIEPDRLRRAEILVLLADIHRATWSLDAGLAVVSRGLGELNARAPVGAFATTLVTVVMFVVVMLMHRVGPLLGRARGDERQRCSLLSELHGLGGYLHALQMNLGPVAMHTLSSVYWANRVGEGVQYAHGQTAFGTVSGALGMGRAATRAFARMMADPAVREPTVHAVCMYRRAWTGYEARHDAFGDPRRVIHEEGQWMDLATYAEGVGGFVMESLAEGRDDEAARLWARAERRLAFGAGERTALYTVPPLLAAAAGQHAEAAAHLRRIEKEHEGLTGAGLTVVRAGVRLFALYEQGETGTPFDEAAAVYEAGRMPVALIPRSYRVTLFHIAMGRIDQCRAAGADRAERIARARAAVATIGKGAKDDVSRSWHRIAAAYLLVVTGQPRKALRTLDADETIHRPRAPLIAFERARVRARAYRELDAPDDARGQARLAIAIAEENEWPHRAGWIVAEFPGLRGSGLRGSGHASVGLAASTEFGSSRFGDSLAGRGVDRQRLAALQHIGAAASRVLDPEALARIALDETIRLLRADRAFLFLVDETGVGLVPHLGRDAAGADVARLTGYSASLVERVRVTREPLVITGTEEGAALGAQSVVLHGLRSIMVAPLTLDERLLGVVYLDSQVAKGIFTADDAGILIALTTHIATSLETARAAQLEISMRAAQRQRDLAEKLREAFEAMTDTLEPSAVLDRLLHWTAVMVPNDGVWLAAAHEGGQVLVEAGDPPVRHPVPPAEFVRAPEQPVTLAGDEIPPVLARLRPDGVSWALLPLRSRRTDVSRHTELGVLAVASAEPAERLAQQMEIAAALVAQGLTAYDNASLFAQVRELAVIDELTGVANRRRFFELAEREFARARRQARPFVAMMLDIDHFKRVNDTLGHPTGDDVIRAVASRLADGVRRTDVLGRYGGEEFSVLLPDADVTAGHELAERLRRAIGEAPIPTRTGPLDVTVSIGVSLWTSDDADVATVLARADRALYEAKRGGRNRTAVIGTDT